MNDLLKIKEIVKSSKTINEVLTKLNKSNSGNAYQWFCKFRRKNSIDTSHFLSMSEIIKLAYKEGKLKKISDESMFTVNSTVARSAVKNRIISKNLIEYKCNYCNNIGIWNDTKISLILDHINGIRNDHRLNNLRFLCPNCNATLETHCKGIR